MVIMMAVSLLVDFNAIIIESMVCVTLNKRSQISQIVRQSACSLVLLTELFVMDLV